MFFFHCYIPMSQKCFWRLCVSMSPQKCLSSTHARAVRHTDIVPVKALLFMTSPSRECHEPASTHARHLAAAFTRRLAAWREPAKDAIDELTRAAEALSREPGGAALVTDAITQCLRKRR